MDLAEAEVDDDRAVRDELYQKKKGKGSVRAYRKTVKP